MAAYSRKHVANDAAFSLFDLFVVRALFPRVTSG